MVSTHDSPLQISRFVLIAFSLLFLTSPADAQSTGTIRGKVTDRRTGEALPFANVIVRGTNFGASTNNEGEFEIERVSPGVYTLVVTLIGYKSQEIPNTSVQSAVIASVSVEMVEASVQIGDVTVFGASLRGEKITDAPAAVSVLAPAEIKLNAVSGQLPKLLENQPGVDIAQSGINDFNVNTRGFNSSLNRRLLVLLDGRDLAVAFLGSQEWNGLSVPVEDLGKIELIRGPGSALYGANAFNGVINILTPHPRDIVGGKVTVAGGEKNTLRTDVRYAGFSGPWSYKANVGRFQGDTWSVSRRNLPFEYAGFNPFLNSEVVDVDRAKVSSTYGSGRVDYEFEEGEIGTIEGGSTQVENEILVTGIGRVQVPKAVKPWGRASYSNDHLFVQLWAAGRNSIDPQVSLSTGLPLEEKSFMGQADVQYRFSVLQEQLYIILGVAHKYQYVDTEGTLTLAAHHDNLSGLYTQLEYKVNDQIKVIAAGRLDRSTLHTSQFSPKLAMVWSPIVGHSIRATFNKAFQAPNYSEMFLNVRHPIRNLVYFGNEDLIVERITGYEVGYKGVFANTVFITVDGYYNQLRDFITDLAPNVNPKYPGQIVLPGETVTRTVWSYGNAGRVNEYGFEVGVNYYASQAVQFTTNYAYFDFKVKEKNANDALLPNAPKHKVNAGVTFRHEELEIGLSGKVVPSYDWAAGIYKGRILAYTLFNLNASYQPTRELGLGLNVTNLFDRNHYQIFGGSLIGRRAVLSLTASF
ncbi:MAG: TonB-dependent receptor [Bacteroidota bacterium]